MFRRHEFEMTSELAKRMTYRSIRAFDATLIEFLTEERRSCCRSFWGCIQPNEGSEGHKMRQAKHVSNENPSAKKVFFSSCFMWFLILNQ